MNSKVRRSRVAIPTAIVEAFKDVGSVSAQFVRHTPSVDVSVQGLRNARIKNLENQLKQYQGVDLKKLPALKLAFDRITSELEFLRLRGNYGISEQSTEVNNEDEDDE